MGKTIVHKLNVANHIFELCQELQMAGYETYVVGGAVRDFLIDKVPKDYDISTAATPEDIRRVFGRKRARIIGRRFRLVHLHHGNEIIEVSTFRRMPSREDQDVKIRQKLSDVPDNMIFNDNEFGSAREDAERRDFTINAVFYDPVSCLLVDHTGMGLDDIHNRVVRAIGVPERRFEEDPVRILRALKFAGQCCMKLEAETEKALIKSLPLIQLAAPSRLTLELEKILKNSSSHKILQAFHDYGFLSYFLPVLDQAWKYHEGQMAMKLLEVRNERIAKGCYRDSISVAMVLMLLAVMEDKYGELRPGVSWRNNRDKEEFSEELFAELKKFFAPHAIIKALCFSAERTLLLLPDLFNREKLHRVFAHPGYPHAREVVMVLNAIRWQDPTLEQQFPFQDEHETAMPNKRKRPRHRSRKPRQQGPSGHHQGN